MNKAKAVVLAGAVLFVACGLYPPWIAYHHDALRGAGYGFIWAGSSDWKWARIDLAQLGVEWLCVLVASGMAWVLVAKPRRDETKG